MNTIWADPQLDFTVDQPTPNELEHYYHISIGEIHKPTLFFHIFLSPNVHLLVVEQPCHLTLPLFIPLGQVTLNAPSHMEIQMASILLE